MWQIGMQRLSRSATCRIEKAIGGKRLLHLHHCRLCIGGWWQFIEQVRCLSPFTYPSPLPPEQSHLESGVSDVSDTPLSMTHSAVLAIILAACHIYFALHCPNYILYMCTLYRFNNTQSCALHAQYLLALFRQQAPKALNVWLLC